MFLEEHYIMWLARIDGISIKKKYDIIDHFEDAKSFFYSDNKVIREYCEKYKINFKNIIDEKDESILNSYVDELYKKDIKYISFKNNAYPKLLKEIPDAPLGFYMIGDMPDENINKIGMIGARKCTQYGAMNAYKFSKELCENNICIVSGMALGIDSMAHKGAIDNNGLTIAVLGCGVDIIYPPSNKNLRDSIIKNGCIISEYPPKTPPYASHFPARNRIISGLCSAIVVVESAKKSGTLITVGQALDQGRDIFAIPGNINNAMSEGTNNLIKDCAFPLTHIDDILSVLNTLNNFNIDTQTNNNLTNNKKDTPSKDNLLMEDDKEQAIYDCIKNEPITIDEIIFKTNIDIQTLQYKLTMLEIKGYIQKLAGQKYIKKL